MSVSNSRPYPYLHPWQANHLYQGRCVFIDGRPIANSIINRTLDSVLCEHDQRVGNFLVLPVAPASHDLPRLALTISQQTNVETRHAQATLLPQHHAVPQQISPLGPSDGYSPHSHLRPAQAPQLFVRPGFSFHQLAHPFTSPPPVSTPTRIGSNQVGSSQINPSGLMEPAQFYRPGQRELPGYQHLCHQANCLFSYTADLNAQDVHRRTESDFWLQPHQPAHGRSAPASQEQSHPHSTIQRSLATPRDRIRLCRYLRHRYGREHAYGIS